MRGLGRWFRVFVPVGILCLSLVVPTFAVGKPAATSDLTFLGFDLCYADLVATWANQPMNVIKRYDVALQNNVNGTIYGVLDQRMTRSGTVHLSIQLNEEPGHSKDFTGYLRFFDRDHSVYDFVARGPYPAECQ